MVHLAIRNVSTRKALHRRDDLRRLAETVWDVAGADMRKGRREPAEIELSLLLCDDPFIKELNRTYRKRNKPTDVLAFGQDAPEYHGALVLGDIVISLETVEKYCSGDRRAMREEVRLLFCHGLLHLVGHDHRTKTGREAMNQFQARFLGLSTDAAWRHRPK